MVKLSTPVSEDAEVSALEDGEVAEDDVAAVLEGDGLVADAGLLGGVSGVVAACSSWPRLRPLPQMRPGPVMREIVDVSLPR